mmetsp:Transcript_27208/g.62728  ORF Transcript_27208/g.62728 Transcript_27208/m.62728 type:complete len:312 (-) Transcript_27208:102-1037(-)|eukprot:CAMPEP_0114554608 /NCGR_PEP_ID=MMETSP0114-20121206/8302_1 /TAXON_ID=31324 /ORGANISM="Goniomonas sp, Strain m" /LENGTH=311 /DNA_ID=CAMNT_0001739669 /DNA_START=9 /DNA_END=944 /DNA_ORIENTATION=-
MTLQTVLWALVAVCAFQLATAQTGCTPSKKVTVGDAHVCLLKALDNKPVCWGRNYFSESDATPSAIKDTTFSMISAGAVSTCGIKKVDDTLYCWGYNGAGETNAPAGTFSYVSVGSRHACAIRSTTAKDIVCWGLNEDGRLNAPSGKFRAVEAGAAHTCAIKDSDGGSVVCWGFYTESPAATNLFTKISVGFAHACGIKTDGSVMCWPSGIPDGRSTVPSDLGTGVKQISTLGSHTCAITSASKIRCWGSDIHGESSKYTATDTYDYVAAGWYYTCGINSAGILVCWGENSHGRATTPAGYTVCGSGDTIL